MNQWQKRERQVETRTGTVTIKRGKSKSASTSNAIPRSLDFWNKAPASPSDENSVSTDSSLSTLGLQQMQGYDHLEQEPLQWADDDDRGGKGRSQDPVSSIAFPASKEVREVTLNHPTSPRKDGARFSSLPTRNNAHSTARPQHQRSRYSTIVARPKDKDQPSSEWQSSAGSSPEGSTTPLGPMSLRQRSMKSLQGIASAWVPSAVKSPYESESESAVATLQKGKEAEEKRPIRLDQRRLQKAVSLAVEAAQASKQDEKAWKQKKKRLARKQDLIEQGEKRKSRLSAISWRAKQDDKPEQDPSKGTLMALPRRRGSEISSDDDDNTSQVTKRPGSEEDDVDSDDEDLDEEGTLDDDFSVDLYISSLSYLLAALGPKDAENVGDRHREEMKRKLEEALRNLDNGEAKEVEISPDREEVIQWRVERELVLLEQAYHQRRDASPGVSRAHQAAQASSQRTQRQSVAGYLTSSAVDLGLSVGAGALAAAARGVASLLPLLTPEERAEAKSVVSSEAVKPGEVAVYSPDATTNPSDAEASDDTHALLTRSQWNLTRTLAQSVASTMYSNLAAVAEQRRPVPMVSREVALYDSSASLAPSIDGQEDASDQLMIIAATLARNVKRSPLPSQIRALTKQVISLVAVVDERYSLSKRSADVALRKTGQALYYVRKNDLHVKALRAVWAIVEASVAAVEAYRDEEEWKGGEATLPARIEDMRV